MNWPEDCGCDMRRDWVRGQLARLYPAASAWPDKAVTAVTFAGLGVLGGLAAALIWAAVR